MNNIQLNGISTHNLKNIDIIIPKNSVTAIYGRSGAGKSSLAFSTLYKLCNDEFEALEKGYSENNEYEVKSYSNIIPAIAISQSNTNNNPRSTLYSYLNIGQVLSFLAKDNSLSIPDYKYLKINRPGNECPCCKGLGEIQTINLESIVNQDKCISEKPFSIWKNGTFSGLYHNLLIAFCAQENINTEVPFKNLSEVEQKKLLFSKSNARLSFKFKYKSTTRRRRAYYEGVMLDAQNSIGKKSHTNVKATEVCPECLGSKVNLEAYRNVNILGLDFTNFLTLPISDVLIKLSGLSNVIDLTRIIDSICDIGLGYLSLSRSIPSLSGGELQKLKFSRLLNSNISGVLLVIDEISSQVNGEDFSKIFDQIKNLSKRNTIVLVEHSPFFISNANYKIHIGPEAGYGGGYICQDEQILAIKTHRQKRRTKDFFHFHDLTKNNVVRQKLRIPKNCLTVFTGPSGSGKSSIARAIEQRENAIYISQKNTNFGTRSVLASSIRINNLIANYFSKYTGFDPANFLLSKEAGCKTCEGIGVIKYERGYDKDLYVSCPTCEGSLFEENSECANLEVNGLTIIDFYNREIAELSDLLPTNVDSLKIIFETMVELGLGHLQLNRKSQTLSSGELRRIKLCEHLSKTKHSKKILIIDEPVAGLDPETASKVAACICQKVHLFRAVILIEHRQEIIDFCDYEIKIGPYAGALGGKVLSQAFLE